MHGLKEALHTPVDVLNYMLDTLFVLNSSPGLLHGSDGPVSLLLVFEDWDMLVLVAA